MALLAVLWIMALLGVLATGYVFSVRTETALTHNWLDSARARAAAEAGVMLAVLDRLGPSGMAAPADGSPRAAEFEGVELRISVLDETGRIDLNNASADLLDGLFMSQGLADDERAALVDAILDWRDADDLRRLNGAEDADYAAAGLDYGAKDGPFEAVEELARVMGMTPALYEKVEGALTVYSGAAGINPRVAPREALLALPGMSEQTVDAYLDQRQGAMIDGSDAVLEASPQYVVNRQGKTFSIEVEARLASGALERLAAVVRLAPSGSRPFTVLAWREAARPHMLAGEHG